MSEITEFVEFPKLYRLHREVIYQEKIDGSNGQIFISDTGEITAGSRNRYLTPEADNFGFAKWVIANRDELLKLGPGRHFGEWWGNGIQRGYGLKEKRFSLFNTERWCLHDQEPSVIPSNNPRAEAKYKQRLPKCCGLVPVLGRGIGFAGAYDALEYLRLNGSMAVPGFMNPEGIVAFHTHGNFGMKMTLPDDGHKAEPVRATVGIETK